MDFDTLMTLGIIGLYFLLRLFGGKKKGKPAPAADQPAPDSPAELDEALREIRIALGMEAPEPAPPPQSSPPPPPLPTAPRPRPAPHWMPAPSPHKTPPREGPLVDRRRPASLADPIVEVSHRHAVHAALLRRMRDPSVAREAMLLHEVLGPPRAVEPLRRRPFRPDGMPPVGASPEAR